MLIRSKLFVSGSRPELFAKAVKSDADAVSFDLEDAVAPDRKNEARALVVSFLRGRRPTSGKIAIVRVNALATAWFARDVAAIVGAGPDVINLPKVESAADVHAAVEAIDRRDAAARHSAVEREVQAFVAGGHLIDAPVIGHARAVTDAAGRHGIAQPGRARGWDAN